MTLHQDEDAWKFMQKLHISRFEKGYDALYDTVREMQNQLLKNEAQKNES